MAVVDKITYTSTPEQVAAMHGAFDEALARVKGNLGQTHPVLINGAERAGSEPFEVHSPVDGEIGLGQFVAGSASDVDDAVAAAKAAYPAWSKTPWQERVAIIRRAAELIREKILQQTYEEVPVSYTHLRAHETVLDLVCRLLLEKKKK